MFVFVLVPFEVNTKRVLGESTSVVFIDGTCAAAGWLEFRVQVQSVLDGELRQVLEGRNCHKGMMVRVEILTMPLINHKKDVPESKLPKKSAATARR